MNGPYFLHLAGSWHRLAGVNDSVAIRPTRPSSQSVSLGGVVRRQRASRVARAWTLGFTAKTPDVVSALTLAAQGLTGDVFLLDSGAARTNMLRPAETMGLPGASLVDVDGLALPTIAPGRAITTMVRADAEYRLAGWTTQTTGTLLGTHHHGDTTTEFRAPLGTGPRRFTTWFSPDADGDVTITTAAPVTALRLTEDVDDDLAFLPGQKAVCQVSVADPVPVVRYLLPGALPVTTYSFELTEVGP